MLPFAMSCRDLGRRSGQASADLGAHMHNHLNVLCRRTTSKVLGCALVLTALLVGQSFLGSITGSVADATGAVVPSARVVATEISTAVPHETATNASGSYQFSDLPPGTYTISVVAAGFKELRSGEIVLTAQQVQRFDARLEIGSGAEKVDVEAVAPTLNAENAEVDGVLARKEFLNLPVNERSTFSFLDLNSFNVQGGDGSSYSIGGLRGGRPGTAPAYGPSPSAAIPPPPCPGVADGPRAAARRSPGPLARSDSTGRRRAMPRGL